MTLKYLYILCAFFQEGICQKVASISDKLHIPVDSYIIEAVWNEEATKDNMLPLNEKKFKKDGTIGAYAAEKVKSWSKWNEGDYIKFNKELKWDIDKECSEWIRIAKKRRNPQK